MTIFPKLLVATTNPGKIREIGYLLAGIPYALTTLAEEGVDFEVEETGDTYEENARLKAMAYAQASGLITLADDSGLEVEALGGAPGHLAARFGGPGLTDEQRVAYLLSQLEGLPAERRTAHFRCVIVLVAPLPGGAGVSPANPAVEVCEGSLTGRIAFAPQGENGFGYDPVFYLPELGLTTAEISAATKNSLSHRGQAAAKARDILQRGWPVGNAALNRRLLANQMRLFLDRKEQS